MQEGFRNKMADKLSDRGGERKNNSGCCGDLGESGGRGIGSCGRPKEEPELQKDHDLPTEDEAFKVPSSGDGSVVKRTKALEPENRDSSVTGGGRYLSPAEQLQQKSAVIPYKEPPWGGLTDQPYCFEVLKDGTIADQIDLSCKAFHVFGRLPSCHVCLQHPSLSRHHAVVQYCKVKNDRYDRGWYLYDLDSTHGTWVNKMKVSPKVYHRLRVGHVVKFGGSTKLFVLQGPDNDREEESELSVSELKHQRERQKREAEVLRQAELAENGRLQPGSEDRGCMWGMDVPDAIDDIEENPSPEKLATLNESLYIDDPKKTLKNYFESEGYEAPEYKLSDVGHGKHRCQVELPIDTPSGPVQVEAVVCGKMKEAVIACALEACRLLDRQGLLRASTHESRKRKKKNWEDDDFYDSDEDPFLDRTGTIEKKREQRMKKAGKLEDKTDTYDSLLHKHEAILEEIRSIETKLETAKAEAAAVESDEMDALDAYMSAIKAGVMDTKTKMKLKRQLLELRQKEQQLRKLVNIAKPATLPQLQFKGFHSKAGKASSLTDTPAKCFPLFGKVKSFDVNKAAKKPPVFIPRQQHIPESGNDDEEEEESEDENEAHSTSSFISPQVKGPELPPTAAQTPSKPEQPLQQSALNAKDQTLPQTHISGIVKELPEKMNRKKKSVEEAMSTAKKFTDDESMDYDPADIAYATWLPPENQSGDGRTSLNEKYGY